MSKKQRTVHYLQYYIEEKSQNVEGEYYRGRTFEQCMDEAIAKLQPGEEVKQRLMGKNVILSLYHNNVICHEGCKSAVLYQIEEGKGVAAEAKDEMGNHIVPAQPAILLDDIKDGDILDNEQFIMANLAEGITYFAYKDNHVAYFSESGAAANMLHSFFSFFLKTLTHVIADTTVIHEVKISLVEPRALLAHKGVKKVTYKLGEMRNKDSLGSNMQKVLNNKIHANPIVRCRHEAVIQECNLDLTLSPGRRDRGIKTETIKALLSSMSDYELEHTIVYFNDHKTMKGKQLVPHSKIFVNCSNGIPHQVDAQRELTHWLARSIETDLAYSR